MRPLHVLLPAAVACALLAACGSSGSKTSSSASTRAPATTAAAATGAAVKTADTKLGSVLVDAQGRTLYHRTDETASHIVCVDKCAVTWPPLFAQGNATPQAGVGVPQLTVAMRPDGKDQVAADGQPLYTFANDTKPGDTNGEGVAGIWHVIKAVPTSQFSTSGGGGTATTAAPTTASGSSGY